MPRIQINDVTPPDRRSIRNIPIPSGGKRKIPILKPQKEINTNFTPKEEPQKTEPKISNSNVYEYYYPKKLESHLSDSDFSGPKSHKKRTLLFGSLAVVAVLIFIAGMMTVFSSASVDIVPKGKNIEVSSKIDATNEVANSNVRYEVIKLAKSKTVSVQAVGEETAEVKASGKITIYNNFSSQPQRLIIRTRFETKDGLIYRIPESVVVPGKTTKNGTDTPGSIEVNIFADEPGEKYNIKKTDFTIPGFKNDPLRYSNFYARSVSDMSGGFTGKRKTVLPGDKQTAMQGIDTEVQADLKKELESKVPNNLVLLSGAIIYESTELPAKEDSSSVQIGKETTAYAIMLNKEDLSNKISSENIADAPDWQNIKAEILNFSNLTVTGIPQDFRNKDKISLQINGKAKVWAKVDTTAINQKLLGQPKSELQKIMDEFPGISSATASVRPIWKQNFPKDPSKVRLKTVVNE